MHLGYGMPVPGADPGAGAPILAVVSKEGSQLSTYGHYEPRPHPIGNALNNQVRLAPTSGGGMWVLYTYRGVLERWSETGELTRRIKLPTPEGWSADAPFVQQLSDDRVSIVRLPVAEDIVTDGEDNVYVLFLRTPTPDRPAYYSEVLAYDGLGNPIGAEALPARATSITASGDTLYVLSRSMETLPVIDLYEIRLRQ